MAPTQTTKHKSGRSELGIITDFWVKVNELIQEGRIKKYALRVHSKTWPGTWRFYQCDYIAEIYINTNKPSAYTVEFVK